MSKEPSVSLSSTVLSSVCCRRRIPSIAGSGSRPMVAAIRVVSPVPLVLEVVLVLLAGVLPSVPCLGVSVTVSNGWITARYLSCHGRGRGDLVTCHYCVLLP